MEGTAWSGRPVSTPREIQIANGFTSACLICLTIPVAASGPPRQDASIDRGTLMRGMNPPAGPSFAHARGGRQGSRVYGDPPLQIRSKLSRSQSKARIRTDGPPTLVAQANLYLRGVNTIDLTLARRRFQDCVTDNRVAIAIDKIRADGSHVAIVDYAVQQMGYLMHKGMFPADDVALGPPVFPPGVGRFRNKHVAEPLGFSRFVANPEYLQLVQAFQIEDDAGLFGVDFDALGRSCGRRRSGWPQPCRLRRYQTPAAP